MTKCMQTDRFLIIGGAGFVGSNRARSLHSDGCHVTCLDN